MQFKSEESRQSVLDNLKIGRDILQKRQQEIISIYNKQPKLCRCCHIPIDFYHRKNDYCSHSCAAKINHLGIKSKRRKERPKCLICGNDVKRSDTKYCSIKCFSERPKIRSGVSTPRIRKRLLKEREHRCSICNLTEWNDVEIPLVVDHIDGNHDNNVDENLRFVCCNCDALLPTYKGRNRGNGRIKRMERYNAGKSY